MTAASQPASPSTPTKPFSLPALTNAGAEAGRAQCDYTLILESLSSVKRGDGAFSWRIRFASFNPFLFCFSSSYRFLPPRRDATRQASVRPSASSAPLDGPARLPACLPAFVLPSYVYSSSLRVD